MATIQIAGVDITPLEAQAMKIGFTEYGDRVAKSASLLIAGLPGTKPNKITDQLFTDDGLRTVFAAYRVRR